MKGKLNYNINEEIPQRRPKINKFQEQHIKHGVSDKFSVALTLNGLGPKF